MNHSQCARPCVVPAIDWLCYVVTFFDQWAFDKLVMGFVLMKPSRHVMRKPKLVRGGAT